MLTSRGEFVLDTPMASKLRLTAFLFALAALILYLPACGNKGPVRPLEKPVPAAPEALSTQQVGRSVLLSWKLPTTNLNDTPLDDLAGFQIWRMSYDPVEDCPECRDTSILLHEVDLEYLREVFRRGDRLFWFDRSTAINTAYRYRITPVNQDRQEGRPATSRLTVLSPPSPPGDLSASGHDRLVRLSWTAVTDLRQGAELLGYFIFRRTPENPFPPVPLNREPVTMPSYEDFGLVNDSTYVYTVRSAIRLAGETIISGLSSEVKATPAAGR